MQHTFFVAPIILFLPRGEQSQDRPKHVVTINETFTNSGPAVVRFFDLEYLSKKTLIL